MIANATRTSQTTADDIDHGLTMSVLGADIDSFLQDPIGFGEFDHSDPISLAEFGNFALRSPYTSILS